ncbi:MAG: quinone-dependent dihydroorotate dehydrogenase [Bacteroidetes bacterium]|nr:quinone-dependent dihydroorotate dehydrogenase [Bacteroidota bacterium]
MYQHIFKPLLFTLDAETAHHITFAALRIINNIPGGSDLLKLLYGYKHPGLERKCMGITFPGPVGLAAGLDKNAILYDVFHDMGFGFVEVGTVTPKAQAGNDKPRLFRLPKDEALINRMGFNNDGAHKVLERLKQKKPGNIIGVNIGKNKLTPNENASDDYLTCLKLLHPVADYFVVNVSSPNTPGLRTLQDREPLSNLLITLQAANQELANPKPILLKIAPDMEYSQLDEIIDISHQTKLSGIVATNTTVSREGLSSPSILTGQTGGLSGAPVRKRSTEVIKHLRKNCSSQFCIIGVGGIFTAYDAKEKLDVGADLIQLYTGYVYQGPSIVGTISKSLVSR